MTTIYKIVKLQQLAMEIKSEYHTNQKTLFRRVNQIKRANGLCNFEEDGAGYRLRYCEGIDIENAYIVLKGKDGLPFRLYHGQEGYAFDINNGDLLIYEFQDGNKVWFSSPALDVVEDPEDGVGYAEYGSVSDMVTAGLITHARYRDAVLPTILRRVIKETAGEKTETPQQQTKNCGPQEIRGREPGIFELLTQLMQNSDVMTEMEKIQGVSQFCDKQKGICVRTLKVMHQNYCTGYSYLKGFTYKRAAQMRLGGQWLERAGFICGQAIKLIAMKDLIVIIPKRTVLSECTHCRNVNALGLAPSIVKRKITDLSERV